MRLPTPALERGLDTNWTPRGQGRLATQGVHQRWRDSKHRLKNEQAAYQSPSQRGWNNDEPWHSLLSAMCDPQLIGHKDLIYPPSVGQTADVQPARRTRHFGMAGMASNCLTSISMNRGCDADFVLWTSGLTLHWCVPMILLLRKFSVISIIISLKIGDKRSQARCCFLSLAR